MILPNDEEGYNPIFGSTCTRRNIRFTGRLRNGTPFIGRITYINGQIKYTLEGKFNSIVQLIEIGKQTSTINGGMIAIG